MKNFKLLARLMGRGAGGNVPLLYARAFHRPLLVEPGLGEAVIQGYLAAAQAGEGERRRERILTVDEGIAVIDVAGALVAHDTIGFCGETPASYPAIARALDQALDDPAVQTVMIRLDSPGGEADGCFDLVDHIYAARGDKKIVAVVDHMAYSAAYAIASACDEIWLSRTGGVGSVGVVTYHVDQSEYNAKLGLKVEYIHAGARKVDGNPHQPLTAEARGWLQAEIDRLHGMFVDTVARNRGLTAEQVRATEAGCYFAEGAIEAGLADHIGTFAQALESYSGSFSQMRAEGGTGGVQMEAAQESEEPDAEPAPAEEPEATPEEGGEQTAEDAPPADPVAEATAAHLAILEACVEVGAPELAADFIKTSVGLDEVKAKLDLAGEIRAACAAAGMPEKAVAYIEKGVSLEAVRGELLNAVAEQDSTEISHHVEPSVGAAHKAPDSKSIYEKRRQAIQK